MDALQTVRKMLTLRKREDIAKLLRRARLSIVVDSDSHYTFHGIQPATAILHLPVVDYVSLMEMPEQDLQQVRDTVIEVHRPAEDEIDIVGVKFYMDEDEQARPGVSDEELIQELEQQKALMISVSTGGPRIDPLTINTGIAANEFRVRCGNAV